MIFYSLLYFFGHGTGHHRFARWVAFAALVSALGFILRGMRSDVRELGSKVDTILFALVHAGLLSPQQVPSAPLAPPSPAADPSPMFATADDAPPGSADLPPDTGSAGRPA